MSLTIFHNPRCSKSRQTLQLIEAAGVSPDIRLYLNEPPNAEEIMALINKLGLTSARELMRKGEEAYKSQNLKNETNETVLIAAMAKNPKLIERPIVVKGQRAVLGRPPENVKIFL